MTPSARNAAPEARGRAWWLPVVFALAVCCTADPGLRPDRLELALKTSPSRLDPAYVVDVSGGEVCANLYEGLVRFDPDGRLVPGLAARWTVDGGAKRYTFVLDRSARFSNGAAVTTADVVYSFCRVLDPAAASPRRWVLDRIAGADSASIGRPPRGLRAPDDSTLVVELARPFSAFLGLLAMPAAMVVPRGWAPRGGSAGDAVAPGTGPWVLSRWKRADYILLAPNRYGRRRAKGIREVRYRIIPEAFTRVAEFESGALDVLEIPPVEVGRFEGEPWDGRRVDRDELRVAYIGLNTTRGPLRDVRVRRALNMAIDVDRLITVLEGGQATRACGAIPPALAGHARRPAWPYDPGAARDLLSEAGFPEGFAMQIWQRDSPEGNRLLEAVQGYLATVGVEVRLVRREWSAFKQAVVAGRVDAFFLDWFADYPDAENFLYPLFHSDNLGGGGNRAFFRDDRFDALLERAVRTSDAARRVTYYASADSLVYAQAPWIFLFFPRSAWAFGRRVRGYTIPAIYTGVDLTPVWLAEDEPRGAR